MINSDASVYEIIPERVVAPENQKELLDAVQSSIAQRQPITMRAGGTSLGGQAIGWGCLIDISKCLTNILAYYPEQKEIVIEPGVIQDDLNEHVKQDGLHFAPDTSTSNRAMIGGMIGNNSCGAYSIFYGTTREHVKSIDVILADGSEAVFGPVSAKELYNKLNLPNLEGHIYRTVVELLEKNGSEIIKNFPHPSIKRRNTGFALDVLYLNHQPFNPDGLPFNLAPLICGSEGTLAIIQRATLNLVEQPKQRGLICAHYDSILSALETTPELLQFSPAAIELIDKETLDCTHNNLQQQRNRFWVKNNPQAVLVIELFDDREDQLGKRLKELQAWLLVQNSYAAPIIKKEDTSKVWDVRKAGLGLLMGKVTRQKAVAVVEDAAVPVDKLSAYYQDVNALMAELKVKCIYYGHVSVGLIHIRPELDLATDRGKRLFVTIAKRNSTLVKKYRGALSGEHGDGRIRAPFLKEQVGEEVYAHLCSLKQAFDPNNLLNPGVIIGDMSILKNLRADRKPQHLLKTGFNWDSDLSMMDAVEKCNGAGSCRKSAGKGVMCPSYQISREENFSTRGRSNLLRFALTEQNPLKALSGNELQQALEMCLGCKACKSECPANVDMARLKSEVLYQMNTNSFWMFNIRRASIKYYRYILIAGRKFHKQFNWMQNLNIVKSLLGVDSRRALPQLYEFDLEAWWQIQRVELGADAQTVWVLCDLYSQYYEPEVGKAALSCLQEMGLHVRPVFMRDSPRALISQGLLKEARSALEFTIQQLTEMQDGDVWMGIEPSEVLTWRDEAKDLLSANDVKWLKSHQALLFEELILLLSKKNKIPVPKPLKKHLFLHVHCHQKSLANLNDCIEAFHLIPGLNVTVIHSGCCGMSGEFGYTHYDESKKIAEQFLLPAIRLVSDDDIVVATGISCRQQIKGLLGRKSSHSAEIFVKAFN